MVLRIPLCPGHLRNRVTNSGGASNVDQVAAALAQMVLATWARIGQTFADVKLWKANGGVHMST